MNVLVVTNMYPSPRNPFYGIFVKDQVESLRRKNIPVDVFFINGAQRRTNYFSSLFKLFKILKRKHYDIIHAHHSYCIFPIIIAKALAGKKSPVILTFHEGEVHFQNQFCLKGIDFIKRLVLSKRLKCMALHRADLVIAVEEAMIEKLDFKKNYKILPCGVDTDLFKPLEKASCRKKLNLPIDKKVIFFPASPANKQKGFDLLEKAVEHLGNNDLLLTSGGNIFHKDMPYFMNAADVVVQLSIFEASPSVIKEALAVNAPMVFTDAGDSAKTVGTTDGYFLCERNPEDVADKIGKALYMGNRCNGRDRIFKSNFTLEAVSNQLIGIYKNMAR